MIRKPRLVYRMLMDLIPRVELAHDSLTNVVSALRDASAEVWTGEAPAEPEGVLRYSVSGWVSHFTAERARLATLRDMGAGTILQRVYPEVYTASVDYFQDIPPIVGFFQQAIDAHGSNEKLNNGERSQLANAIEAKLEA